MLQNLYGFLIQYNPTKEKLLYATDTYYIKYKFNKLNYLLVECNYNKEIAKENSTNKVINKTRYIRLLESHFSLENLLKFLNSNDLTHTNSNQEVMQKKVYEQTKIKTDIASSGLNLELRLYPF